MMRASVSRIGPLITLVLLTMYSVDGLAGPVPLSYSKSAPEETRLGAYQVAALENTAVVARAYQLPKVEIRRDGQVIYEVRCEQKWVGRNLNYTCVWKPRSPKNAAASLVLHGYNDSPLIGWYLSADKRFGIRGARKAGFLRRSIYTSELTVFTEDEQTELLHINQNRPSKPRVTINDTADKELISPLYPLALVLLVLPDMRNQAREHFPNEELQLSEFRPDGDQVALEIETEPNQDPALARHILHAKTLSDLGQNASAEALTNLLGRVATIDTPQSDDWVGIRMFGALLGGIDAPIIGGDVLGGNTEGNDMAFAPTITGQVGAEIYAGLAALAEGEFGTSGLQADAVKLVAGTESAVRSERLRFGLGVEYRVVDEDKLALALGFVTSLRILDAKQDSGREELRLRYTGFDLSPRFGVRYKLRNWMGRASVELMLDGRVSHVVWSSSIQTTERFREDIREAFVAALQDDDTWHVGAVAGLRFGF